MTRVKQLVSIALVGLALAAGASTAELTRKVNEYEGQHLASQEDGGSGVYKRGSFDITLTGDPSQWG